LDVPGAKRLEYKRVGHIHRQEGSDSHGRAMCREVTLDDEDRAAVDRIGRERKGLRAAVDKVHANAFGTRIFLAMAHRLSTDTRSLASVRMCIALISIPR
jgi:hypothetical protein